MSQVAAVRAGAIMAWQRAKGRVLPYFSLAALATGALFALLERVETSAGAADRTLVGLFRIVVPLLCFASCARVLGAANLREACWAAARFGHGRAGVALGQAALAMALSGGSSLLVVATGLLVARAMGPAIAGEAPLWADLGLSSAIGFGVGAAYAAWFALGATFGARGQGRWYVLIADFLVGSLGFFALVFPRGAAYSLIGRELALDLPQRASSALLLATTSACLALVALRCRR